MGQSKSGLCLTRDQPDQVRLKIFKPSANWSESRVRSNDSFLEGGQVSFRVKSGRNSPNLAKNWVDLAEISVNLVEN